MSAQQLQAQQEELADFAILLAEATVVLSALSIATPPARAEELAELRAVHAEGEEFSGSGPLAESLHRLFDAVLVIGADLALVPETPLDRRWRVVGLQRIASALAAAFDEPAPDALARVNHELHTLDPNLPPASDLPQAVAAAAVLASRI